MIFKLDVMHFDSEKENISKGINIIYNERIRASQTAAGPVCYFQY